MTLSSSDKTMCYITKSCKPSFRSRQRANVLNHIEKQFSSVSSHFVLSLYHSKTSAILSALLDSLNSPDTELGTCCFYSSGQNVEKQNSTRALKSPSFSGPVPFFMCMLFPTSVQPIIRSYRNCWVYVLVLVWFPLLLSVIWLSKQLQRLRETLVAYCLVFIPAWSVDRNHL